MKHSLRKILSLCLILTLAASLFTGCAGGGNSKKEKRELSVFNWGDYLDMSVLDQFEKETGIHIVYSVYETNEEMYLKLSSGGSNYDVLFPSEYMIERLIKENRLAKLDFSRIPNYGLLSDVFKGMAYDPNNEYAVPYTWGTLGILYNDQMVDEVPTWETLWNEKYKGEIIMSDSVRDAFTPALKMLGYSCNEKDPAHLNEAKELLLQQAPLVYGYYVDEARDQMAMENAALAVVFSGDALEAAGLNEHMAYVVPEYSNLWVDSMVVPASAEHKDEAMEFINFMCRTDIVLKNMLELGYSTPSQDALKYLDPEQTDAAALSKLLDCTEEYAQEVLDEELLTNEILFPDESVYANCEIYLDLGEANAIYDALWTEIKASIR